MINFIFVWMRFFMDKTVIVAGGTGGIGSSITKLLEKELINKLYIIGRDRNKFEKLNFKQNTCFLEINQNLILPPHDIFINCVGAGYYSLSTEFNSKDLDKSYRDNLKIPMLLIKKSLNSFIDNKIEGWIININSMAGLEGFYNGSLYSTFKFGLRGFLQVLRTENRRNNIRVSELYPGIVDTKLSAKMPKKVKKECMIDPLKIASVVENIIRNNLYVEKIVIKNDKIIWE